MSKHSNSLTCIGNFSISESKEIFKLLEKYDILYKFECDDRNIRDMSPGQAAYGGTFGFGVRVFIYVKKSKLKKTREILSQIFPA